MIGLIDIFFVYDFYARLPTESALYCIVGSLILCSMFLNINTSMDFIYFIQLNEFKN